MERLSAKDIIEKLKLEPLIPEGGWFSQIWYKKGEVSAIYYLLREGEFSEFHVLPGPEQYFFLMGDPVEHYRGRSGSFTRTVLGQDLTAGQELSLRVEGDEIQGSRLVPGGKWALLSTVMSPAFEMGEYRQCSGEELQRAFPNQEDLIRTLTN
ncbi:MAG: cupin domain-containing protein [Spirochaetales bacterium]|nr:cupin domain-containing protein [Spirochaetales bacterium]